MVTVLMSEKQLQDAVAATARALGLKVAHFRTAKTARGAYVTPVGYDGKGWPDLSIAGKGVLAFAELKARGNRTSVEQDEWLQVLAAGGAATFVWWPEDLTSGRVEASLRGLVGRAQDAAA